MRKTFWLNAGLLSARRLPLENKLQLIQRATLPVADQHMVRWPFTSHRARQIDRMQRKMLLICNPRAPRDDELFETHYFLNDAIVKLLACSDALAVGLTDGPLK